MHIRSDRTWDFEIDRASLWSALSGVDAYPQWWPWLRDFRATALRDGDVWSCVICPPLPYRLRLDVRLDEVVPEAFVAASVDGDIVGTATVELRDRDRGCEVRLVSDLAPANPLLRTVARSARPLVRYGHDWVLDTGARQFSDVSGGRSSSATPRHRPAGPGRA